MSAQRPLTPLVEAATPAYMTGLAIGMVCGILAVLIVLGVINL
jgi:hypothetical protein